MANAVIFDSNFIAGPIEHPEQMRLIGSKCHSCGIVNFGKRFYCDNCSSKDLEEVQLPAKGKIYSHSVVRFQPPPPYKGPDPFVPLPVAWVALNEKLKVISYIVDCPPEKLAIDMEVEMVMQKGWTDEKGNDVLMYAFRPVKK